MATKLISKPQVQQILQQSRKAGYTVDKIDGIYRVTMDALVVFKAMPGSRAYLCTYDSNFLTEEK